MMGDERWVNSEWGSGTGQRPDHEHNATTAQRRPNLTGQGGLAEIRHLLAERTPLYAAAADIAIDGEGKSPDEIARHIAVELRLEE